MQQVQRGLSIRIAAFMLLLASSCTQRQRQMPPISSNLDSYQYNTNAMSPFFWEPAGDLLSDVFIGSEATWLNGSLIWTLPGMTGARYNVIHKGQNVKNHMQYSVKTRKNFSTFTMSMSFKFEEEDSLQLPLSWRGNSGIYIFGLYEIQIFNSGLFDRSSTLKRSTYPTGELKLDKYNETILMPIDKALCGSIYGGNTESNAFDGAPQDEQGNFINICGEQTEWHHISFAFTPAVINNGVKKSNAIISGVLLDGKKTFYNGKTSYEILGPTGTQVGRPEASFGQIALQDHGSRLSFKDIRIYE